MKQNDAVVKFVCEILGQDEFESAVVLTKPQRDEVVAMVTDGIMKGEIDFSAEARAKHDSPAKIKSYVTGMVSNHLRKDKRLNGGERYVIKNPGSRVSDEQLKALKSLRAKLAPDSEEIQNVDEAIAKRTAELAASKTATQPINIEALPENLRHLVVKQ